MYKNSILVKFWRVFETKIKEEQIKSILSITIYERIRTDIYKDDR
jgi:hypothetical protein